MRVLVLTHYYPPESNAPAARTHAHCRRWSAAGHEVTVVTCVPNHPRGVPYRGYRNRVHQVEELDGVRVVRLFTFLAANVGVFRRAASWLSYLAAAVLYGLLARRPDVVLATSPQFFCAWAGVLVGAARRRPLLLEIRDLWPASIAAVGAIRARPVLWALEKLERRAYAAAAHIVTVGDGYRCELIARGVAPERVSVVMNGVDTELFHPRPPNRTLAARLGVTGRFVVAWCGTIGLAHGLEVVLRAAGRLLEQGRPDIVFLLVGDGARLDALRDAAARRGLDNVVFAGRLDRAEIPEVLSCADVCLVHLRASPLFTTVMPSKIFEAAAMGRPLVLGMRGFARRFVEDAGCGLCVEPGHDGELVEAVLRLAGDPGMRRRLGEAGRAYVQGTFDRDRLASRYLELIRQFADHRAATRG